MKKKKSFFWAVTVLFLIILLVAALELFARYKQYETWTRIDNFKHVPILTLPDKELGWINKPGFYRYSVTNDGNNFISVTINADHSRGRNSEITSGKPEIWFFGDSFTYGFGVTDGEEFTARIQELLKDFRIRNFGAPGYSTLQCMMMFRKQLKIQRTTPAVVVYGLIYTHGQRNVADLWWLKSCLRAQGQQSWVAVPYARYNELGKLEFYPPKQYAKWPFSEYLAGINYIQDHIALIGDLKLRQQSGQVTLDLLTLWAVDVKRANSQFLIFNLCGTNNPGKLRKKGFSVLDKGSTDYPKDGTTVPVDGHPNHIIHEIWARAFVDYIHTQFSNLQQPSMKKA